MSFEKNSKGEHLVTRANSITTHTAPRSSITNMYHSHEFTIV